MQLNWRPPPQRTRKTQKQTDEDKRWPTRLDRSIKLRVRDGEGGKDPDSREGGEERREGHWHRRRTTSLQVGVDVDQRRIKPATAFLHLHVHTQSSGATTQPRFLSH